MKFPSAAAVKAVSLGLCLIAAPARAESFLNYVLPSVFGEPDKGPKPEETLQAPFGKDLPAGRQDQSQAGLMNMYEAEKADKKTDGLDQPHRNADQIGEWLTSIVTQALTVDPLAYDPTKFTSNFTPYALQEYQAYMTSNQTIEVLKSRNMKLTAFAESKPVLVQEGALEGSYRWLFRVPVMLTYYDRVTTTLKGGQQPSSQTQRVIVNIQVGRVPMQTMIEGMMIERWSVAPG